MSRDAERRPAVLALLHLPPPVHGASTMAAQLAAGDGAGTVRLRVVPLRFARGHGDLGRASPRKAAIALGVAARQLAELIFRRPDAGYMALSTRGAPMLRDALYLRLFRLWRVPYAVHLHTLGLPDTLRDAPAPVRWWVAGALRGAARVIVLNRVHARELETLIPGGRVAEVPNGIPDLPDAHAAGGRETGADGGRRRVLFLSNMLREKGPLELLEALPAIRAAHPSVRPTFAGDWPDPAVRQRFLARSRQLGLDPWIEVVGPVDGGARRALLDEAAVFVFPSYHPTECCPLAVIEAMRQGVPVVAARQGGVPELVGDAGVLVPPRDPDALARAVAALLADPAGALRLGTAARERFERLHRADRWERAVATVLQAALAPADTEEYPALERRAP
jgi:glycosyltransferase involved in cell wall biosynthesis